jgi:hypothetical protein
MDVVRSVEYGPDAILAVTMSSTPHILAFYWDGTAITPRWVCRSRETMEVLGVEDLSILHSAIVGVKLIQEDTGRLRITFGVPLHDEDLYFAELPNKTPGVVFHKKPHGLGHLQEIFVNVRKEDDSATCFCKVLDLTTGISYVDQVDLNIGPILRML